MIVDSTGGMGPTHPGTWVPTLVVEASLVPGTLWVHRTLGLALNIGVAHIIQDAATRRSITSLRAIGISTTWGWVARLNHFYWSRSCAWSVTLCKGVSYEALVADTQGNVVANLAVGVNTTKARTRVLALSANTSPICWAVCIDQTLGSAVGG